MNYRDELYKKYESFADKVARTQFCKLKGKDYSMELADYQQELRLLLMETIHNFARNYDKSKVTDRGDGKSPLFRYIKSALRFYVVGKKQREIPFTEIINIINSEQE